MQGEGHDSSHAQAPCIDLQACLVEVDVEERPSRRGRARYRSRFLLCSRLPRGARGCYSCHPLKKREKRQGEVTLLSVADAGRTWAPEEALGARLPAALCAAAAAGDERPRQEHHRGGESHHRGSALKTAARLGTQPKKALIPQHLRGWGGFIST